MAKCPAELCSFETAPGSQYCSLHSVGLAEERHDVSLSDTSLTTNINMPAVRTGPVAHPLQACRERSSMGVDPPQAVHRDNPSRTCTATCIALLESVSPRMGGV